MSTIFTRNGAGCVDASDPALAGRGASPVLVWPEDPTLAISDLEDLFPPREATDLETCVRRIEAVVTEALLMRC